MPNACPRLMVVSPKIVGINQFHKNKTGIAERRQLITMPKIAVAIVIKSVFMVNNLSFHNNNIIFKKNSRGVSLGYLFVKVIKQKFGQLFRTLLDYLPRMLSRGLSKVFVTVVKIIF